MGGSLLWLFLLIVLSKVSVLQGCSKHLFSDLHPSRDSHPRALVIQFAYLASTLAGGVFLLRWLQQAMDPHTEAKKQASCAVCPG